MCMPLKQLNNVKLTIAIYSNILDVLVNWLAIMLVQ